ncbi:MAG: hypothetical protein PF495_14700 [Spirochaetales bacterium]|jgi:hypothetical protein|nr:hypothetical protein [Spirochaetales bacterium]
MTLHILSISPPENPVVLADCRIPCTVKNDTASEVEARVFLYDEDDFLWNYQPTFIWQNIKAGDSFDFDGFWDTLHFVPPELRDWNLRIELHEQTDGKVDTEKFILKLIKRPDWWGSLLDNVGTGNVDAITNPILDLFTGFDIPGFTKEPYVCFLCGTEFTGDDADTDFAAHLIDHLQTFISDWFKEEEEEDAR